MSLPDRLAAAERLLDEDDTEQALAEALAVLDLGGDTQAEATLLAATAYRRAAKLRRLQPGEAEAFAKQRFESCRSKRDGLGEAAACVALAEIAVASRGEATRAKAERQASQALAALTRAPASASAAAVRVRAAALRVQSAVCAAEWDEDGALKAAEEACKLAKEIQDKRTEALALHVLALARANMDPPALEEALEHEGAAVALVRQLGIRWMEARGLCQMARWSLAKGAPREGLRHAQAAFAIRKGREETGVYITALAENAQTLKALQIAREAVERARSGSDRSEQLAAQEMLAKEYRRQANVEQALLSLNEALELARSIEDRQEYFAINHEIAAIQVQRGQLDKAAAALRLALDAAATSKERAASLCALAVVQTDLDQLQDAISSAAAAQLNFHEEGDAAGKARAAMIASAAHRKASSPEKALEAASLAFEFAFVAGHLDQAACILKTMADMYVARGMSDEAMRSTGEALRIWQELGDAVGVAQGLCMAANLYLRRGALEDALSMAQQAWELSAGAWDVAGEARAQVLLAQLYAKQYEKEDNKDAAEPSPALASMLAAAGAAQTLASQVRDKRLQAVASHWFAQALMLSSRPSEDALRMSRKAQALFRDLGDTSGEAQALTLTAYLLLPRGELEQASQNVERSLSLADAAGDFEAARGAREAKAVVERMQEERAAGRTPGAFGRGRGRAGAPSAVVAAAPASGAARDAVSVVGKPTAPALEPAAVRSRIMDYVRNTIGTEFELQNDSALLDSGMDSLSSIDFTNQVTRDFNLKGASSLVFDYPTVAQIVDYIIQESRN